MSADLVTRWRSNPIKFIETVLCDPETKAPFKLLDAEREFLEHAFKLNADGRLLLPRAGLRRAEEVRQDRRSPPCTR